MKNSKPSNTQVDHHFFLGDLGQLEKASYKRVAINAINKRHCFSISVPHHFELDSRPVTRDGRFKRLALFRSNRDGEVSVAVSELERDVSPLEWFCGDAEEHSIEILKRRDLRTPGGVETDCLTQLPGSRLGRAVVFKDGSNLFCIESVFSAEKFANDPQVPFAICQSFKLTEPTLLEHAEAISNATCNQIEFHYPGSWILKKTMGVSALTSTESGGTITIDTSPVRGSAEGYARHCHQRHYPQPKGTILQLLPTESSPQFEDCYYGMAKFGNPQTVIVLASFLHLQGRSCIMLQTPSFKSNSRAWAVNKRAYEIVRDSFRTA